jgi:hypothetical protein
VSISLFKERYLIFGFSDGVVRVLDTRNENRYQMFGLSGVGLKTISCIKVDDDTGMVIFRLHLTIFNDDI